MKIRTKWPTCFEEDTLPLMPGQSETIELEGTLTKRGQLELANQPLKRWEHPSRPQGRSLLVRIRVPQRLRYFEILKATDAERAILKHLGISG